MSMTLFGAMVAACGSTPGATQGPGGGGPTQAPGPGGATQPPGGGVPGAALGTGTVHLEIGGDGLHAGGDYPFFAIGSRFSGEVAGVALNFTSDSADGLVTVSSPDEQTWVISFIGEALTANATECQLSNWNIGTSTATGTFDCKNGFASETATGAYHQGVTMKGNFTAAR
jgi:hypothetical protein